MKFANRTCRLLVAALGVSLAAGCGDSWSSAAGDRTQIGAGPVRTDQAGAANPSVTDPSRSSTEAAPTTEAPSTDTSSADMSSTAAQVADANSNEASADSATGDNGASPTAASTPAAPPVKPAPPAKPATSTRIADISFDDIKFDMEKGAAFERSMLTSKIEALDGRKIRIRGFILPPPVAAGLTRFVLVRDNLSCCFGPGAALYDAIFVEMVDDKSTDYTISPVTVEGVFTVRELRDPDDNIMAIYHLDGEIVR